MITLEDIYDYTLTDIYQEPNEKIRNQMLKIHSDATFKLGKNRITKRIICKNPYQSISNIETAIEEEYQNHTSEFYFPGEICCFYPKITEFRARNFRTCDISGGVISPGSFYLSYRPLIDNLTRGKTYVLKRTIHAETSYFDFFPNTLYEFEYLSAALANPYETVETLNNNWNYEQLSKTLGEYLPLLELRKKKKLK